MQKPELSDNRWGMPGKASDLERSFPVGMEAYQTCSQDHPLTFEITLHTEAKTVELLWWSQDDPGEEPGILTFSPTKNNKYELQVPVAQAGRFIARVRYGHPDYGYTLDSGGYLRVQVAPSGADRLLMYSFVPRQSGKMSTWPAQLDAIKAMGFTHVHVIPVTTPDVSQSPYAAKDLFMVNPDLADEGKDPLEQWEGIVEYMEKIGLGLVVDLVLNHVGLNAECIQKRPEWVMPDPSEADGFKRAGWSDGHNWYKWEDLALLNFRHHHQPTRDALWEYMTAYALQWAGYAARTGGMIRLDNLHSSDQVFMMQVMESIRTLYPTLLVFGEIFADAHRLRWLVRNYGVHYVLSTPWEVPFVPGLRGLFQHAHDTGHELQQLTPMTSHDSGSPAQEFGDPLATRPRYAASALLGVGLTGMAQGAEFGIEEKLEFIGEPVEPKYPKDRDYRDTITRCNNLVLDHTAFQQSGNLTWIDHGHDAIMAALRKDLDTGERFLVCMNFDTGNWQSLHLDLNPHFDHPAGLSTLTNLAQDTDDLTLHDGRTTIHIEPGGLFVAKL